jgi:hypothetical protein
MSDEQMEHCRHCGPQCKGGRRIGFEGLRWAHTSAKGADWRPGECPGCDEATRIEVEIRRVLQGFDPRGLWSRVKYPRRYRTGIVRGLSEAIDIAKGEA